MFLRDADVSVARNTVVLGFLYEKGCTTISVIAAREIMKALRAAKDTPRMRNIYLVRGPQELHPPVEEELSVNTVLDGIGALLIVLDHIYSEARPTIAIPIGAMRSEGKYHVWRLQGATLDIALMCADATIEKGANVVFLAK